MIDSYIYVILSMILFFIVISFSVFFYYRWKIINFIHNIENPKPTIMCPCPTPNIIAEQTIEANLKP